MADPERDDAEDDTGPLLLTPGPLTTAPATRRAMLRDRGSRDPEFVALTADIRRRLVDLAGGAETHVCVPLQGSGTFAVEAMLGTLIPPTARTLVVVNGAYGRRMARILEVIGRTYAVTETPEDVPANPAAINEALSADPEISHVTVVHCETTSGILNPLDDIAAVVERHRRSLLVDAMSSFGAIPLDARRTCFDALAASANKCLEGVPGLAFVIARRSLLEAAAGNAHSLSLDLTDQWRAMEANGQWRFTPPTHVVAALASALDGLEAESGVSGRNRRYSENCRVLVDGMRALGFETLLDDDHQAPIIVTFKQPADPAFEFARFYELLRQRGFAIYPGKLTAQPSFRIGCIGAINAEDIRTAIAAVEASLRELRIAGQ